MPSVKTTAYVCNGFNTSFCARGRKTNQAISSLNRKSWNKSTQQIKLTICLTDVCFNKKFEQEKKRFYKISISKSIYVDTYYILFVIIATEYDLSSNEIFFLTSRKGKRVVVLRVKIIYKWKTMSPIESRLSLTGTKSTLLQTFCL